MRPWPGTAPPVVLLAALGTGRAGRLWNGILVAVLKIQPLVATPILMVAGRGVAQLITGPDCHLNPRLSLAVGSGNLLFFPTPVMISPARP